MQKHGGRSGTLFKAPTGNPSQINSQGLKVLKSILENPQRTVRVHNTGRFGKVMDIKTPNGGARFTADGKEFLGFIN